MLSPWLNKAWRTKFLCLCLYKPETLSGCHENYLMKSETIENVSTNAGSIDMKLASSFLPSQKKAVMLKQSLIILKRGNLSLHLICLYLFKWSQKGVLHVSTDYSLSLEERWYGERSTNTSREEEIGNGGKVKCANIVMKDNQETARREGWTQSSKRENEKNWRDLVRVVWTWSSERPASWNQLWMGTRWSLLTTGQWLHW